MAHWWQASVILNKTASFHDALFLVYWAKFLPASLLRTARLSNFVKIPPCTLIRACTYIRVTRESSLFVFRYYFWESADALDGHLLSLVHMFWNISFDLSRLNYNYILRETRMLGNDYFMFFKDHSLHFSLKNRFFSMNASQSV